MRVTNSVSIILLLVLSLGLQACDKTNDPVYIEKLYATSSFDSSHHPAGIFNGDGWKSFPVVGGTEGVMFYILDKESLENAGQVRLGTDIYSILVECDSELTLALYINGSRRDADCNREKFLGSLVSSVFIRLSGRSQTKEPVEIKTVKILDKDHKERTIMTPGVLSGSVNASSTLSPQSAYDPIQLFDGRTGYGWVEGKPGSDNGVGQSVTVSLNSSITLTGFEVYNGYQRSQTHFEKNAAIDQLKVTAGDESRTISLENVMGNQRALFDSPLTGKTFTFIIESAHKGTRWQDTAISEMILVGEDQKRYIVNDPRWEKQREQILASIENSPLQNLVGRSIYRDCEAGMEESSSLSLFFRPNGSFVFWKLETSGNTSTEVVMDGNWVVKNVGSNESVIEIFGRMLNTSETSPEPYSGGDYVSTRDEYIFSEKNLKITRVIEGEEVEFCGYETNEGKFVMLNSSRFNGAFRY